jgi:hypothetical protein
MDHMQAIEQIREIISAISHDPATSPGERLILEKVTSLLAQIPAGREKEHAAALGGNPASMQLIQRALGGGAG